MNTLQKVFTAVAGSFLLLLGASILLDKLFHIKIPRLGLAFEIFIGIALLYFGLALLVKLPKK